MVKLPYLEFEELWNWKETFRLEIWRLISFPQMFYSTQLIHSLHTVLCITVSTYCWHKRCQKKESKINHQTKKNRTLGQKLWIQGFEPLIILLILTKFMFSVTE